MSSCLIIQQENKCYIGSDTAVSCNIGDNRVRIGSGVKKTFVYDNKVIFCSGNMELYKKVTTYIKSENKLNISNFIMYLKDEYDKSIKSCNFEVFICEYIDNNIQTTQISSYDDFEPITRIIPKGQVGIFAMGYNTDKIFNDSIEIIKKTKDISKIYLDVFNNNICNEVGGKLNLFEINGESISEHEYKLDDNTPELLNSFNKTASLIMAKLLVGSVILGEKLYVTSEDGSFYVGNMEEKKGFGLSIKDSNLQQRIFLGTEVDSDGIRRAKLRLLSKDGREIVLDENGILNTSQAPIIENISAGYGFEFPYIIDGGVTSLKKVMVTLIFSKYRGYTRGSGAGGSTVTTSSSGGGFSYGSTSGDGGYYYSNTSSEYSEIAPYQTYTSDNLEHGDGKHNHTYYQGVLSHAHGFTVEVPSHSHYFSVSQPNHNHSISLQNHEHTEIHGIYVDENSGVQNAKIYVNDILVAQNINSDKFQFDITNYLKLNSTNYIKITNEKNVRVCVNLFEKKFVSW